MDRINVRRRSQERDKREARSKIYVRLSQTKDSVIAFAYSTDSKQIKNKSRQHSLS